MSTPATRDEENRVIEQLAHVLTYSGGDVERGVASLVAGYARNEYSIALRLDASIPSEFRLLWWGRAMELRWNGGAPVSVEYSGLWDYPGQVIIATPRHEHRTPIRLHLYERRSVERVDVEYDGVRYTGRGATAKDEEALRRLRLEIAARLKNW
jgi:hypothetical protein